MQSISPSPMTAAKGRPSKSIHPVYFFLFRKSLEKGTLFHYSTANIMRHWKEMPVIKAADKKACIYLNLVGVLGQSDCLVEQYPNMSPLSWSDFDSFYRDLPELRHNWCFIWEGYTHILSDRQPVCDWWSYGIAITIPWRMLMTNLFI